MSTLFDPVAFPRGKPMPNRFMLAPLTNSQSHADGTLSDAEIHWLTMRADGGYGSTMTAAAHVQPNGQGFPGQLGIFDDAQLPGLTLLANKLNAPGSVSIVQLYHGGNRCPAALVGTPVCPSDDPATGARAMSEAEVRELVDNFVAAAVRAERAGFDGVELHGAHGYILCQFLSAEINHRTDAWGGDLAGRSRILFEIIGGIRQQCGPQFILGVRLSPERFGMQLMEVRTLAQQLIDTGKVDFLDMSLWDCFKAPNDPAYANRSLLSYFTDLDRRQVKLGFAGKIHDPAEAERVIDEGADFVVLGRVAMLHHDYPNALRADPGFTPLRPPVTRAYLAAQGMSPAFMQYMLRWEGFIADE